MANFSFEMTDQKTPTHYELLGFVEFAIETGKEQSSQHSP